MVSKLKLSPPRISRRCPSPCRSKGRWMIAKALCSNSVWFRNNQPHGKPLHESMELDFNSVKRNCNLYVPTKDRGGTVVFFNNVERSCNMILVLPGFPKKVILQESCYRISRAKKKIFCIAITHSGMQKSWCTIWNSKIYMNNVATFKI